MIKISALFIIFISLSLYSSLEIAKISANMMPSDVSRGNLVQMMVQVQTENDPKTISQFVDQLRKMLDNLVESQEKHKRIHANMMDQCLQEDKFRKKEVEEAGIALENAGAHRAKCDLSLKTALKVLPELKDTLKTYVEELRRATEARRVEAKKYNERKRDYAEAIAFLNDFISFVNKKLKGHFKAFSLVQFSEQLLQHSIKLGLISSAVPILVAISEATYSDQPRPHDYEYKPNEELGAKLKSLLENLRTVLLVDNRKNDEDEAKAINVFTAYRTKLESVISTLRKNIDRTENQIQRMQSCVDAETKIIANASSKLARNQTLRDNADKMCASFNNEFIDATRNRLDEINTMHEILVIVKRRFATIPGDLINYLESVKDGWRVYVNSTKFQAYVSYQRKAILENARGKELVDAKNLLK